VFAGDIVLVAKNWTIVGSANVEPSISELLHCNQVPELALRSRNVTNA